MMANYWYAQLYEWVFCFSPLEKELNYRAVDVVLTSASMSYMTIGDLLGKLLCNTGNIPSPLPMY